MNQNERYFRSVSGALGWALIIFFLFVSLMELVLTPVYHFLSYVCTSNVSFEVVYQTVYAGLYLLMFMLPVAFFRLFLRKTEYEVQPMKCQKPLSKHLPLIVCAGIALVFGASFFNSLFTAFAYWVAPETTAVSEAATAKPKEIYQIVLDILLIGLVPGFCEEFLFRGTVLSNLLPFGKTRAILLSAMLFSLMHQNVEQTFYTFVAGIVLGLVYERTGSIWNCTVLHSLNNIYSVLEEDLFAGERDLVLSNGWVTVMEVGIFFLGAVSLYFLIRSESERKPDLRKGFFGKELPEHDGYAEVKIDSKRFWRCFLSPSMTVFIVCCFAMVIFTFLAIAFGWKIYG